MQLVRRKFADEPTNWDDLQQHTVYQWGSNDVFMELPMHIEGPLYLQGKIKLCEKYPNNAIR